jgi:3'-phosphoadenosine 5'-phosphosulfate sulfotransferase (PAPS reductase)/FAD synthetase
MKHVVGFSGGIDSQECAAQVIARFGADDTILLNSNAGGWEDPLTIEFVEWYSMHVHPVIVVHALVSDMWETPGFAETKGLDGNAVLTYQEMCRIKGRPPARRAQFCTSILKLKPQRRWMRQEFGPVGQHPGEEFERYTGVRRDESAARANYPDREWDDFFDCYVNHPIAAFTKEQCFAGAKARGEEINPLYRLGFNRVGCAPCINSGKADIMNWLARRPEMIDKVRLMERDQGRTFFAPVVPGMATNTIDQVIEWSQTGRGGRQPYLFPILEREACESKYGLCE